MRRLLIGALLGVAVIGLPVVIQSAAPTEAVKLEKPGEGMAAKPEAPGKPGVPGKPGAPGQANVGKTAICHWSDDDNRFVGISIPTKQLSMGVGHARHAHDVRPAPAEGCSGLPSPPK